MSQLGPNPDLSFSARMSLSAGCGHDGASALGSNVPSCEQSQQTTLYSITSSALASSDGGTVEAKCLGGLEVDRQLVFGRRLYRQVGGLLALENAINVVGRLSVLVDKISSI